VIGQFGKPPRECARQQSRIIHNNERRLLPRPVAHILLVEESVRLLCRQKPALPIFWHLLEYFECKPSLARTAGADHRSDANSSFLAQPMVEVPQILLASD
jgi:hypothetical protein